MVPVQPPDPRVVSAPGPLIGQSANIPASHWSTYSAQYPCNTLDNCKLTKLTISGLGGNYFACQD